MEKTIGNKCEIRPWIMTGAFKANLSIFIERKICNFEKNSTRRKIFFSCGNIRNFDRYMPVVRRVKKLESSVEEEGTGSS